MWWRRPTPPAIRFSGHIEPKGWGLVRLPEDPALASLALDAVYSLRLHHEKGLWVLAPESLFPQLSAWVSNVYLQDLEGFETSDRGNQAPQTLQAFWDLGMSPLPVKQLRFIYARLYEAPHLSLHDEGTMVFRLQQPFPLRWKRMLELVGVAWKPLEVPVDRKEERAVVDFLKGRFGWKGQPLLVMENVDLPPSSRFCVVSLDHPEIQPWSVKRKDALLALARGYVGIGVHLGMAYRRGLCLILSRHLPVDKARRMERRDWNEIEKILPL